ncbi:MAG: hypothetical protein ACYTGX_04865 [Planctomycetota bacterium]|jgi:hypothetical protein
MRWSVVAAAAVVASAIGGVIVFTGGPTPLERSRAILASTNPADAAAVRAELTRIAQARETQLLPEVTQVWERTFAAEGFQQRDFRPGSLAPQIHAVFQALGPAAASELVAWAESEPRFIPCLLAAGVALGGESSAVLGRGQVIRGVQVRAWRFTVDGRPLEVPTYMEGDWYGRLEVLRAWRDAVVVARGR